jgi:hypothetical protein
MIMMMMMMMMNKLVKEESYQSMMEFRITGRYLFSNSDQYGIVYIVGRPIVHSIS